MIIGCQFVSDSIWTVQTLQMYKKLDAMQGIAKKRYFIW